MLFSQAAIYMGVDLMLLPEAYLLQPLTLGKYIPGLETNVALLSSWITANQEVQINNLLAKSKNSEKILG